jgi:rod shape-determining protein MreD
MLLGNLLLCAVIAQANHSLASWQLRLWPGGLLVATAALQAGFGAGASAVFLTGLALDAAVPVPFGAQALVLLAGHAVLFALRRRLVREATPVRVTAVLATGAATFLAFALIASFAGPGRAGGGRVFADLTVSLMVSGMIAPWFFALQGRLLALAQAGLRAEEGRVD